MATAAFKLAFKAAGALARSSFAKKEAGGELEAKAKKQAHDFVSGKTPGDASETNMFGEVKIPKKFGDVTKNMFKDQENDQKKERVKKNPFVSETRRKAKLEESRYSHQNRGGEQRQAENEGGEIKKEAKKFRRGVVTAEIARLESERLAQKEAEKEQESVDKGKEVDRREEPDGKEDSKEKEKPDGKEDSKEKEKLDGKEEPGGKEDSKEKEKPDGKEKPKRSKKEWMIDQSKLQAKMYVWQKLNDAQSGAGQAGDRVDAFVEQAMLHGKGGGGGGDQGGGLPPPFGMGNGDKDSKETEGTDNTKPKTLNDLVKMDLSLPDGQSLPRGEEAGHKPYVDAGMHTYKKTVKAA